MKAIVNGRVLLPDGMATGKALLYDERIRGLAAKWKKLPFEQVSVTAKDGTALAGSYLDNRSKETIIFLPSLSEGL